MPECLQGRVSGKLKPIVKNFSFIKSLVDHGRNGSKEGTKGQSSQGSNNWREDQDKQRLKNNTQRSLRHFRMSNIT